MNRVIVESLEDIQIALEIDALSEDDAYPYLAAALEECGVEHIAPTFPGLLEQAEAVVQRHLLEANARQRKKARRAADPAVQARRDAQRSKALAGQKSKNTALKKVMGVFQKFKDKVKTKLDKFKASDKWKQTKAKMGQSFRAGQARGQSLFGKGG